MGLHFLKQNPKIISFGFSLCFLSGFGQTFAISLYLPSIQAYFDLSDAGFSTVYSAATLCSALSITWLGSYIDKIRLNKFTNWVLIGLACSLFLLSQSYHIILLFLALYGTRLFGQGMMSHTAITSMARIFDKNRGKAMSLAGLGHSFGEAILPIVIVSLIAFLTWRGALISSSLFVLAFLPLLMYFLFKRPKFSQLKCYLPANFNAEDKKNSNKSKILKSKLFWILMPSSIASAAIGTAFLLFKLKLGMAKGWSAQFVAIGFTSYALYNALSNLLGGYLSDKFTGKFLYPFYLLPHILGILALVLSNHETAYILLVSGIGSTNGFGSTVKNVTLTELYGSKIIGTIRSLFIMVMIFSTALGPIFFGYMLDGGYSFEVIGMISMAILFLCTLNAVRLYRFKNE